MARNRTPKTTIAGATALVTGAGSGIGRATALALAAKGATVLCVDLDLAAAQKTAAACEEAGAPSASAHAADVSDRAALERLAGEVEREHGALDVLVNNAGVGMTGRFLDMSERDWTWIRGVNLDGVINGCAAFAPAMVEAGRGHVVNVSSGLGYTPTATEPGYVTTKAAVLALSQCLRADWAKAGVGVSAICPGVINTPIIDSTRFLGEAGSPERQERTKKVFRKGHKPEQVADAIVDAVERDRAVVPVGFEAKAGWYLHRLAPIAVQQVIARQGLK
jgi:NAD(P)-dependent dehydrogenase (short-subunit alcohol dehydrogenase family)